MCAIEWPVSSREAVGGVIVPHRRRVVAEIVGCLAQAEVHPLTAKIGQRTIIQQIAHLLQHRLVSFGDAFRHRDVEVGGGRLKRAALGRLLQQIDGLVELAALAQHAGK